MIKHSGQDGAYWYLALNQPNTRCCCHLCVTSPNGDFPGLPTELGSLSLEGIIHMNVSDEIVATERHKTASSTLPRIAGEVIPLLKAWISCRAAD